MDIIIEIIIYLLAGCGAGLLSGLFGVGGGLIIVPVLLFSFALSTIDPSIHMSLAVGTSFATMVLTSFSSFRAHSRKIVINYRWLAAISAGLVVGVVAGGYLAVQLPGGAIKVFFVFFLVWVAYSMWHKSVASETVQPLVVPYTLQSVISSVFGVISALIGIGGGTMVVPFLHKCGCTLQQAIAMSSGTATIVAISGVLTYFVVGQGHLALPPYAIGFIYLPACICIITTGVFFAKLGAKLAHRLNERTLKRIFSVFLVVIALHMAVSLIVQ